MTFNVYWYALIAAGVFLLLSPGILVTVPNSKDCSVFIPIFRGNKECATSFPAVAVHALIFGLVMLTIIFICHTRVK